MASTSSGQRSWDESGFRELIQRYFEHRKPYPTINFRLPEDNATFLNYIYDIGFAIHHENTLEAKQMLDELRLKPDDSEYQEIIRCLLLCGGEASYSLVRFFVEEETLEITGLLSSARFRNKNGENPLHIAIENDRSDVVDYLLKEWVQIPVKTLQTSKKLTSRMLSLLSVETRLPFRPLDILNGIPLHFDSSEHFKKLRQVLPADFSVSSFDYRHICYFLQRMAGRGKWGKILCEEYWTKRRVENDLTLAIKSETSQDPLEEILQAIEDDTAFLSACLRVQDIPYVEPLWEIYGHEPEVFHFMADWAASVDAYYFFNPDLLESWCENMSGAKFKLMLQSWSLSCHTKLANTASFLRRLQRDWMSMHDCWLSCQFRDTLPLSNGLALVFKRLLLFSAAAKEAEAAVKTMQQLSQPSVPSQDSASTNESPKPAMQEPCLRFRYLLASAGSGKTHRLMDVLSNHYGFYLISGAINDDPTIFDNDDDEETLYRPRATGSSRDTKLLFETTQVPWLRDGPRRLPRRRERRCILLLQSRLHLLSRVMELSEKSRDFTLSPRTWLQYQLSCRSERDSFLRIFRLSMIADRYSGISYPEMHPRIKEVIWCLDEVQCDLFEPDLQTGLSASKTLLDSLILALRIEQIQKFEEDRLDRVSRLSNRMDRFIDKIRAIIEESGDIYGQPRIENFAPYLDLSWVALRLIKLSKLRRDHLNHVTLLSGTALAIDKVRAVVQDTSNPYLQPTIEGFMPSFALLTDDQTFLKVFDHRISELLNILYDSQSPEAFIRNIYRRDAIFISASEQTFRDSRLFEHVRSYRSQFNNATSLSDAVVQKFEEFKPRILRNSVSFRGRYRWSVYYVEKLLETFFMNRAITDHIIDEVTKNAKYILKGPLKRRLKDLAKMPEKTTMLKEVFDMAIDADLFGRSRILCSNSTSDLIEQALGYVESASSEGVEAIRVCLAERLVVESVMEYLEETGQLMTLVDEYLYANQFSETAIGEATEFGFAVSVKWLSSQTLPQRQDFVSAFDTVYRISAAGCAFNQKLDLGNFSLEAGDGLSRDYRSDNGENLGLTQWLRLVRENAPRPTFFFPEQVAGPDVMFVFKENGGMKRIVFAIQLKTGPINASLDKVLNTIDPDRWFSPEADLKKGFRDELQHFRKNRTMSLLSILCATTQKMGVTEKHDVAIGYMEKRMPIPSKWKDAFRKDLKELKSAEYQHQAADAKLQTARQALREQEDASGNEKSRREDACQKALEEVEIAKSQYQAANAELRTAEQTLEELENTADLNESTDYHFQILAHDSVEKVFGRVFARLIEGIKSKKPFIFQHRSSD